MRTIFISFLIILLLQGCAKNNSSYNTLLIDKLHEEQQLLSKEIAEIKSNYSEANATKNNEIYILKLKKSIDFHENILLQLVRDVEDIKNQKKGIEKKSVKKPFKKEITSEESSKKGLIDKFPASTFKTLENSHIYDDSGEVIDSWANNVSFTSYMSRGDLYLITGYFKEKNWVASNRSMWIKKSSCEIR